MLQIYPNYKKRGKQSRAMVLLGNRTFGSVCATFSETLPFSAITHMLSVSIEPRCVYSVPRAYGKSVYSFHSLDHSTVCQLRLATRWFNVRLNFPQKDENLAYALERCMLTMYLLTRSIISLRVSSI